MAGERLLRHRMIGSLAPRVVAALMCLPLLGGSGIGSLVDTVIYPDGACCCERAHGLPHHCHCAEPHDASTASQEHMTAGCGAMFGDEGPEFGPPELWRIPPLLVSDALATQLRPLALPVRMPNIGLPGSRLLPPPPTPPPTA